MGRQERGCECEADSCFILDPSGKDFTIGMDECDVRVDIVMGCTKRVVIIWGYVKDCRGCPVSGALVELLQYGCRPQELRCIARTFTDCNGCYRFELPGGSTGRFRVVASKPHCGREPEEKDCHNQPQTCDPCGPNWEQDWARGSTQTRMTEAGNEDGRKPKNKIYYY